MSDAPVKIGMTPTHPGEFIRAEILDELGLSVSAAAEVLGVRRATLSDLLNGKAALSAEMALRIEKAFGVDMEMLLRMQAWHDTHVMRQREGEIVVKRYRPPAPEPR
jgi:antitoxin HigA-1